MYLLLMLVITLMGISLLGIGQQWTFTKKRDNEAELQFRGTRIKTAIELYAADHQVQRATRPNQYPLTLEDLTKPPRRYLPVVYKDPMTGKDFELIRLGGQVVGVKSRSTDTPLDRLHFKSARTYRDVQFRAEAAALQGCMPLANSVNPLLPGGCAPAQPAGLRAPLGGSQQAPAPTETGQQP